jgi:hypothetical protein
MPCIRIRADPRYEPRLLGGRTARPGVLALARAARRSPRALLASERALPFKLRADQEPELPELHQAPELRAVEPTGRRARR